MTHTTDLVFAGVGGQGVLLIAEITALAAARCGFDVKQTEVHGVSQRGGSVESHVRFGPGVVHSPLVRLGQAEVVVALEKLEALRFGEYVRTGAVANGRRDPLAGGPGLLLVNDHEMIPGSVAEAAAKYPHHAFETLRQQGLRLLVVPATQEARALGDARAANVVILGALAALLPQVEVAAWQETLQARVPGKVLALNLKAFDVGRALARQTVAG
jgi:indolepyruvate ferredoxin oxidoreductase beta subunit